MCEELLKSNNKRQTNQSKMAKNLSRCCAKQSNVEKMFSISSHQGNETLVPPIGWAILKRMVSRVWQAHWQLECCAVGEDVRWGSHPGKLLGGFFKI